MVLNSFSMNIKKVYLSVLIYTIRSALSTVIILAEASFCSYPFLKVVFQSRPSFPRYQLTWNVSVVLSYSQTIGPGENLKRPDLSLKTVMLLMLVIFLSGQRCQTVNTFINVKCYETGRYSYRHKLFYRTQHSCWGYICSIICKSSNSYDHESS